jgi:glycosyltransferase involved in cell wall biosynthesis
VVHTVHGLLDSEPWHGPWFKRWAARYTDAIATVSAPLRDYLVERAGVPRGSITIVPNGVDTDVYRPGPAAGRIRKQFGLGADSCIIGHVARFSAVKNHEMLLHAFARVVNEVPGAFLALAGDGPLRAAIEAMIRELGIESRVGLLGHMSEQVPSLYREFDVFVLPSLAEGTSMSILEAMASGVPVVATAVGGTPDVLDHGRSGVLVPSRDAEALAAALGALLRNPSERKRLGSASRQRIRELYSEEVVLSEYERLYTGGVAASSVAA